MVAETVTRVQQSLADYESDLRTRSSGRCSRSCATSGRLICPCTRRS
ncbi:hypothetical protein H2136_03710 [Aeromonas hydrophila]|uniref:Uncharacterized protein n=1 Tax=Aeromonas hydrophila TaxID=644 RepID=A0A926FJU4_AERHY|nr:hypothetical protein [Aeromonas hydrophila]